MIWHDVTLSSSSNCHGQGLLDERTAFHSHCIIKVRHQAKSGTSELTSINDHFETIFPSIHKQALAHGSRRKEAETCIGGDRASYWKYHEQSQDFHVGWERTCSIVHPRLVINQSLAAWRPHENPSHTMGQWARLSECSWNFPWRCKLVQCLHSQKIFDKGP